MAKGGGCHSLPPLNRTGSVATQPEKARPSVAWWLADRHGRKPELRTNADRMTPAFRGAMQLVERPTDRRHRKDRVFSDGKTLSCSLPQPRKTGIDGCSKTDAPCVSNLTDAQIKDDRSLQIVSVTVDVNYILCRLYLQITQIRSCFRCQFSASLKDARH